MSGLFRRLGRVSVAIALVLVAHATASTAQPLTIAAASDLQGALPQVLARFEQDAGVTVRVTFGSSGNFFGQIQNGAPFDLFLSADIDYPRQLERTGLGVPGTLYQYATGQIVLWTTKANQALIADGLRGLTSATVRRIAIANPEHAPYGRAAVAALTNAGVYQQVRAKLVLGENISQAAQFVQSGNAQVGIVARSVALIPAVAASGVSVALPAGSYPPIAQAGIVIRASKNQALARRFLDYLKAPAIVAIMRQFGFELPARR
jgi:molybdate transport system substrate-binding protein